MQVRTSATACNAALSCVAPPSLQRPSRTFALGLLPEEKEKARAKRRKDEDGATRDRDVCDSRARKGEESGLAKERKRVRGTRTRVSLWARVPSIACARARAHTPAESEPTNSSLSIRPRAALNVSRRLRLLRERGMERDRRRSQLPPGRSPSCLYLRACVLFFIICAAYYMRNLCIVRAEERRFVCACVRARV